MVSGNELIKLKDLVVENFDSSDWLELGALTNMMDKVEYHSRLLRSLSFGDPDYSGHALSFIRDMIGKNNENLEVVRNYIYQKSSNAGENISSDEGSGRKIVFSPDIFEIPVEEVDEDLVAVMMSFSCDFDLVYETIKKSTNRLQLNCLRADDIWDNTTIMQDVFSLIFRSSIVVCDFTGKNPNVFYEAGIAHTLGKHVIPITQSKDDIPFDLQHHRHLKYVSDHAGLQAFENSLVSRLEGLTNRKARPFFYGN